MVENKHVIKILEKDLAVYKSKKEKITYPIDVEDFALKVFGLDVVYSDFEEELGFINTDRNKDLKNIYGGLYPDDYVFKTMSKVILINTNINQFFVGNFLVPKEWYQEYSERQTIAHEIAHYSELQYIKKTELNLFSAVQLHEAPYILFNSEVFANKYARNLLMPEEEVKKLKLEIASTGPLDMSSDSKFFIAKFGVTQFMLEIRLKELNISFVRGIYLHKFQKSKGKKYTEDNLLVLLKLSKEYDLHPHYGDCERIAPLYNKETNQDRDSGSLYMTIWRINSGFYDYYESVVELRITYNLEIIEYLENKIKISEGE